jgi:hypothetical protein
VQVRVSDAAGNHGTAYSAGYTLDNTAPTLAITTSKAVLNSADAPLITFTFSEAPVGFSGASVSVSGGVLSGFSATANPLVYTAVFTPTAGQAAGVAISVAAGAYTDTAGNNGVAAAAPAISYATVAPGVAILSDVSTLKAGDTANITFKFSGAPVGFAIGDVTVGGGTLSGLSATADPLVYTAVFTPSSGVAAGGGTISVANGSFTDVASNAGVGGSMSAISIDTLAPTLSITSSAASLNSSGTALITFTFSEPPAAFSLGDISATNGTLSNLVQSANPLVYTAVFTPAANVAAATAVVTVAAGAYADVAGNSGAAGNSPGISIDTLAPGLAGGSLLFSSDTGSSNSDLITRTAAQTMAGTLSGGVLAAGDVVEVSLNNGSGGAPPPPPQAATRGPCRPDPERQRHGAGARQRQQRQPWRGYQLRLHAGQQRSHGGHQQRQQHAQSRAERHHQLHLQRSAVRLHHRRSDRQRRQPERLHRHRQSAGVHGGADADAGRHWQRQCHAGQQPVHRHCRQQRQRRRARRVSASTRWRPPCPSPAAPVRSRWARRRC